MKKILSILFPLGSILSGIAQETACSPIMPPSLSDAARNEYKQKLVLAKANHEQDTTNTEAIIWYGRRTAYLGNYMEAITIFSKGIALHPADARLYRHRGHRYITIRCFDKAIEDFKKAARLVKGQPDEMEPDGLPNAKNIPTSTLQSNIWYHLGLAHFIKGEYRKALKAYKKCLVISKNADMYAATANWMNITLRKSGKIKKAIDLYYSIDPNAELLESRDYMNLLELYRDKPLVDEVHLHYAVGGKSGNTTSTATVNFGAGFYCLLKGNKEKAREYFEKAIATNQWASFGFIAAEAELARMK
jgi:tetratricopeptide (TPR) repeat protein